ncbi:MAG: Rrf2 family transcriptional regulator [Candidatus Bipolaricaulota bacterium]
MHLTKRASYGLIAAVELARAAPGEPVSAAWIAERYGLPAPFIEKILRRLRQTGVVTSRQGRGGGYALAEPPAALSVRRVLEALGERLDLVDCLGTLPACHLAGACPTQDAWRDLNERFRGLLDTLSLADLGRRATCQPPRRAL